MSKVSYPTSVVVGLVGPKETPKGPSDGEQVNIPALRNFRYYLCGDVSGQRGHSMDCVAISNIRVVGKSATH